MLIIFFKDKELLIINEIKISSVFCQSKFSSKKAVKTEVGSSIAQIWPNCWKYAKSTVVLQSVQCLLR